MPLLVSPVTRPIPPTTSTALKDGKFLIRHSWDSFHGDICPDCGRALSFQHKEVQAALFDLKGASK